MKEEEPKESSVVESAENKESETTAETEEAVESTVAETEAISDPFSNKGEALTGEYDLSVSMSLPSLQTDAVRAVIGEKGENMTGPLVETSSIGDSKTVGALFSVNADGDILVEATEDYTHMIFKSLRKVCQGDSPSSPIIRESLTVYLI